MTTRVQLTYRPDEARFRAEFIKGTKVLDYKYLTNDEWEAFDGFYHLPKAEGENLSIPAGSLYDCIFEGYVPLGADSNFFGMLETLLKK